MGDQVGDLDVTFSVDAGDLGPGLDGAVTTSKSSAQAMAGAFTTAADSIEAAGEQITATGQGTAAAASQMGSVWEALSSQISLTGGELLKFDAELATTGTSANSISATMQRLTDSLQGEEAAARQAAPAFASAAGALNEMGTASSQASAASVGLQSDLLKLAGISITVAGLKAALTSAFEGFATLERATESLVAMTHNADLVAASIQQLRTLAKDDALAFPMLLRASQQMTAFGIAAADVTRLLAAAADSSRATGKEFDSVTSSLERIVESGTASGRALQGLGLTTKDLAGVMGVSAAEVAKMFKALDESARVDVIVSALGKFQGVAANTANDLSGQWQRLKNTAEQEFEEIGAALAPLAGEFITLAVEDGKAIAAMIKDVISFGKSFSSLPDEVTNAFAGIAIAVAANPLAALGLEVVKLGMAWRSYDEAVGQAEAATKKYDDSLGALAVRERQMFAEFPEFAAKFNELLTAVNQGAISNEQYQLKVRALNDEFHKLVPVVVDTTAAHKSFTESVADLKAKLDAGTISQAQYHDGIRKLVAAYGDLTEKTKSHILSVDGLLQKQAKLDSELLTAQTTFDGVNKLYLAGATSAGALERATDQLAKAQKAANDAVKGYLDYEKDWIDKQGKAENAARQMAIALDDLTTKYNAGELDQTILQRALDDTAKAFTAAGLSEADLIAGAAGYSVEVIRGTEKTKALVDGVNDTSTAFSRARAALKDTSDILPTLTTRATDAAKALHSVGSDGVTSAEAVKGAFVGTVQVVTQFNQVVGASGQVLDSMRDIGVDAMSQLANAVQHVEEEWKKFTDGVGSFKPNLGLGGDTAGGGKGKGSGDQIASFGGFSGSPQDMLQQFQNLFGSLTPQPFVNGIFSDMQQFLIGFERTALRTALANYYALHQSDAVHYDEYGATSTQGGSSKGPGPAPVDPLAGMVPIPGAPGHYQTPPAQDGVTMGLQSLSGAIQNLNTDASKGGAAMVDLGTAMQGSAYLPAEALRQHHRPGGNIQPGGRRHQRGDVRHAAVYRRAGADKRNAGPHADRARLVAAKQWRRLQQREPDRLFDFLQEPTHD